jgi:pimeloyl-ACP methyl ester carboxylesterase
MGIEKESMKMLLERMVERQKQDGRVMWLRGSLLGGVVLLVSIGAVYQAIVSRREKSRYPPPGRLVDVGGHRLHYLCLGEGSPTVILDAGLSGSSLDWSLVQPQIATFTRVCAYDRAGYGWSDAGPKPRSSQRLVEELSLLLSKAGLQDQYVLVGHSFGGWNMRLFACQHPEHVVGMVLVDAAPEDQSTRLPKLPFMQSMRQQAEWQLFRLRPLLARLGLLRLWGTPMA